MKNTLLVLFLALAVNVCSQGNLQFNQVLTYGGNSSAGAVAANNFTYTYGTVSYTVPSGKVWKVESFSGSNTLAFVVNNQYVANATTSQSSTPVWLKAGDVIRFGNNGSAAYCFFLSIVEFNVVP